MNDLIQVAGHKRDDLNPVAGNHGSQRIGYSAANQGPDSQLRQPQRLLDRHAFRQRFVRFSRNPSRRHADDMNPPRDIEDGRDAAVPVCKCRFHRSIPIHIIHTL